MDNLRIDGGSGFYPDQMISQSRRSTEPDTHLRHRGLNSPAPSHPKPHRAITYDKWTEQHRRIAATEPMVEYVCADDSFDNKNMPTQDYDPLPEPRCSDDEESPMTIPAGYHFNGMTAVKPNPQSGTRGQAGGSAIKPRSSTGTSGCDERMIDKISTYVLSKSGASGQPDARTRHLVEDLAAKILEAIKTDSWDHVPKELLYEVKAVLS